MDSIRSSDSRRAAKTAGRSALEGLLLAGILFALLAIWLEGRLLKGALAALVSAWAVSSVGVTAVLFAKGRSLRTFLWALGAGMGLRVGVLAGWMAAVWGDTWAYQAAVLGPYALGVLALLLVEYRQLLRLGKP